jgi:hypothetical protein
MIIKERLFFRIPATLKHQLDDRVARGDTNMTQLMERYITEGLARDAGELIEQSSLPAVSQAVRIELSKSLGDLYDRLSADLQRSARKSDDRLAALIVKSARSAGIAWRMAFAILTKTAGHDAAIKAYDDAKERTGKDLAARIVEE